MILFDEKMAKVLKDLKYSISLKDLKCFMIYLKKALLRNIISVAWICQGIWAPGSGSIIRRSNDQRQFCLPKVFHWVHSYLDALPFDPVRRTSSLDKIWDWN